MFVELITNLDELKKVVVKMGLVTAEEEITAQPLTGGVSSSIFKVTTPGGAVFCMKQALPKLKVSKDWFAPVERVFGEIDWLQKVKTILPNAVPDILGVDRDYGCFAMRFLPPDQHANWKALLMQGDIDRHVAQQVGTALATIHSKTANSEALAQQFAYDDNFYSIRLEPYLAELAKVYPELSPLLRALIERTQNTKRALVHGDISPKNILVGPKGPVFIDAECAWYGDPAFDLAFCLNHLLLKSIANSQWAADYLILFSQLAQAYLAKVDWEDPAELESRVSTLLPALALARVDGKSPAEYLSAPQQQQLREMAGLLLNNPNHKLSEIAAYWHMRLVR